MLKCLRVCVLKLCMCVCMRARRRMRKTRVCVPSFFLSLSFSRSFPSFSVSLAACVPRAQHHLSSLSHLSPILSPPLIPSLLYASGRLRFFSLSPPSYLSFSTSFPGVSRLHKKKEDRKYILVHASHGSPRGLAFKSRESLESEGTYSRDATILSFESPSIEQLLSADFCYKQSDQYTFQVELLCYTFCCTFLFGKKNVSFYFFTRDLCI